METTGKKYVEQTQARTLTERETAQVSGGHSHAGGSPVFMARKPGGGLSSCKCDICGVELPDAGAYFEHKKMVHGG